MKNPCAVCETSGATWTPAPAANRHLQDVKPCHDIFFHRPPTQCLRCVHIYGHLRSCRQKPHRKSGEKPRRWLCRSVDYPAPPRGGLHMEPYGRCLMKNPPNSDQMAAMALWPEPHRISTRELVEFPTIRVPSETLAKCRPSFWENSTESPSLFTSSETRLQKTA